MYRGKKLVFLSGSSLPIYVLVNSFFISYYYIILNCIVLILLPRSSLFDEYNLIKERQIEIESVNFEKTV